MDICCEMLKKDKNQLKWRDKWDLQEVIVLFLDYLQGKVNNSLMNHFQVEKVTEGYQTIVFKFLKSVLQYAETGSNDQ